MPEIRLRWPDDYALVRQGVKNLIDRKVLRLGKLTGWIAGRALLMGACCFGLGSQSLDTSGGVQSFPLSVGPRCAVSAEIAVATVTLDTYGGLESFPVPGGPRCPASTEIVVTTVNKGKSTILRYEAHGFASTVETKISTSTGGWERLNGQWTATRVDANQFSIPLDSRELLEFTGFATVRLCFFDVRKVYNRWVLVTPKGNAFWAKAIQNISDLSYPGAGRYVNKAQWATHVRQRMKRWGFNTVGQYSSAYVENGSLTSEPLPILPLVPPTNYAFSNTDGLASRRINNLMCAMPKVNVYTGGRLIDVYDPEFEVYAMKFMANKRYGMMTGYAPNRFPPQTDPWIIAWTLDDGDDWFGLS